MKQFLAILCVVSVTFGAGCMKNTGRGSSGSKGTEDTSTMGDGGRDIMVNVDGGGPSDTDDLPTDPGPGTGPDAGSPDRPDAGGPGDRPDTGSPDRDAGSPASCREVSLEPVTTPVCAQSTTDCAVDCTDNDCLLDCLDADPSEDCLTCVNLNLLACYAEEGCQEELNCALDCAETDCSADGCPPGVCETERSALRSCQDRVDPMGERCGSAWVPCLPPPMMDP